MKIKNLNIGLLILLFTIPFWYFKSEYIPVNFTLILGVVFSPFIFQKVSDEKSRRYFIPAIGLAILLFFYQSSTAYFFFFGFSILFILENYWGKLNWLPIFLFLIISPLFQYLTNTWSFPIRLELSQLAGIFVSKLGWKTEVVGNIIYLDDFPFSVDPECMGLKMISTSLLIGLLILAHFERKRKGHFAFWKVSLGMGLVGILAVLANFTRLLILVIFRVMPDNFMHDVLGLLSLVVYVILPFYFLGIVLPPSPLKGEPGFALPSEVKTKADSSFRGLGGKILTLTLFILLILNGPQFLLKNIPSLPDVSKFNIPNFKKSITENNMIKLENDSALIYIKPPVRPFQGSHDPRVCWKGSGYEFSNIQIKKFEEIEIYTALLTQNEENLYTAWWFDNGKEQTIGEWDWRWQTLRGAKGFWLINVSSFEEEILEKSIYKFLKINAQSPKTSN